MAIGLILGCDQEKPTMQEYPEENIRVIELDPQPRVRPEKELTASTNELSQYDCDLNWILFDFNSFDLNMDAKVELQKVASILKENNNFKARIRAYTDSKGSVDYNKKLSDKRAMQAKMYLLDQYVPEKKISAASFADANPIAENTEDDTGRKYNRRIELFIIDELGNTVCRSHPPRIPRDLRPN